MSTAGLWWPEAARSVTSRARGAGWQRRLQVAHNWLHYFCWQWCNFSVKPCLGYASVIFFRKRLKTKNAWLDMQVQAWNRLWQRRDLEGVGSLCLVASSSSVPCTALLSLYPFPLEPSVSLYSLFIFISTYSSNFSNSSLLRWQPQNNPRVKYFLLFVHVATRGN